MRQPAGFQEHAVCPAEWRHTPDMTGSYELDGAIMHNANSDVPRRLHMYLKRDNAYGPRGYSGYDGYSGDD
jgi:hypothetical protein